MDRIKKIKKVKRVKLPAFDWYRLHNDGSAAAAAELASLLDSARSSAKYAGGQMDASETLDAMVMLASVLRDDRRKLEQPLVAHVLKMEEEVNRMRVNVEELTSEVSYMQNRRDGY